MEKYTYPCDDCEFHENSCRYGEDYVVFCELCDHNDGFILFENIPEDATYEEVELLKKKAYSKDGKCDNFQMSDQHVAWLLCLDICNALDNNKYTVLPEMKMECLLGYLERWLNNETQTAGEDEENWGYLENYKTDRVNEKDMTVYEGLEGLYFDLLYYCDRFYYGRKMALDYAYNNIKERIQNEL